LWLLLALALLGTLLLPWFYGTSDGDALTVTGMGTGAELVLGFLTCAAGLMTAGLAAAGGDALPWLVVPSALGAIALTTWMRPRGELYSGYEFGPGSYVAYAVAAIALAAAVVQLLADLRARTAER
jgi:O-antigen/teichoic acid export membrane protein